MSQGPRHLIYEGKCALVTGASSGIGESFARELAARGADIILTARREHRLHELAAELQNSCRVKVTVLPADLSLPGAAGDLLERATRLGKPIDILINCAGTTVAPRFADADVDRQETFLSTNVRAPIELIGGVYADMLTRHYGRILNVSSTMAFFAWRGWAHALSRGQVLSITRFSIPES